MNRKLVCVWMAALLILLAVAPKASLAAGPAEENGSAYRYASVEAHQIGGGAGDIRFQIKNFNPVYLFQTIALEIMVVQANAQIEYLVRRAQITPEDDVDQTLRQIDAIVARVFAYAESIGAVVGCDYVEYYIDGRYVLIDPIKIIRL